MSKVMVDTCGWIDFFRHNEGRLGDRVVSLIEADNAVICDVVVTELLQGAKGKAEKRQLQLMFDTVQRVNLIPEDWDKAGMTMQVLRSKGITLPLTDALIAIVANRLQLQVLTVDKHFDHLPIDCVSLGDI